MDGRHQGNGPVLAGPGFQHQGGGVGAGDGEFAVDADWRLALEARARTAEDEARAANDRVAALTAAAAAAPAAARF